MNGKIRRVDFSPAEWLEGTNELDNATRGLYITACALMWARGGPIDYELLRAASRDHGHAFKRQYDCLVRLGKLTVNGGQITNKRAINELQKAGERTAKASQNGIKGNEIKQLKIATRSLDIDANHQPSTINHQPTEEREPGEVVPLAARARRASSYRFEGLVIRITTSQLDQWRKTFHGIVDLAGELTSIDAWLYAHDSPKDWFHRTASMLNKKHQEAVAAKAKASLPLEVRYPNEGVYH